MSGHSKWATTKRKKAGIDAKRAKLFTKAAKLITIAARDGKSGDVMMNPGLRLAVDNAKAASMPKENIDRAIKKGLGGAEGGAMLEEIIYEAYAPGGTAVLIECLTDNKNRAIGEIRAILNKKGGTLASSNSVNYLFKKVGQLLIEEAKNSLKGEEMEMAIIESGADDFAIEDGLIIVTCGFTELNKVKTSLEAAGIKIDSAEIVHQAMVYNDVPADKVAQIETIIDLIDDLDDVNNVYSNANL